jgi:hypothetical protein
VTSWNAVVLPDSAESVVPVASRNTSSGEMPDARETFAFKLSVPLVAEQVVPAVVPPPVLTLMLKAGSDATLAPSDTLIRMLPNAPAADGVPVSAPVVALNVAQAGRFWTPKDSVAPVAPVAVGVNEYAVPTVAVVAGVPLMVGTTVTVVLAEPDPALFVQVRI